MFSYELDNYISQRKYTLSSQEGLFVMNTKQHSQIIHIKYNPYNDNFSIDTSDGWHWIVKVNNK